MRALTHDTVVGAPLSAIFDEVARRLAAASRGALEPTDVSLSQAPDHTGADFAFACFPLARAWRKNPAQIAAEMATALAEDGAEGGPVAIIEAAGPYLNLTLDHVAVARTVLAEVAASTADDASPYGDSDREADEVVMMEYVSPNTNKPLHIGHLRNAVLGRCVANLLESQGAEVV
ncbi:MAG: arginine--tRNA ligase, partial [Acidobacteriota bacterium]